MEILRNIKARIVDAWLKIPLAWRMEIVSCLHTFVATFAVTVSMQVQSWLQTGHLPPMGLDAFIALSTAAARAAWKTAATSFVLWLKNRE